MAKFKNSTYYNPNHHNCNTFRSKPAENAVILKSATIAIRHLSERNHQDMTKAEAIEKIEAERSGLIRYLGYRFGMKAEAEDVVQDAIYQLIDNFDDLSAIRSLTSWLYRVVNNRAIDLTRKKKPALWDDLPTAEEALSLEEILPVLENTPEDEYMRDWIALEMEKALNELPKEQKEAFVLNEFEGYAFKELAQMLGVSKNTLISRKRYALLYLRERLNELYKQLND